MATSDNLQCISAVAGSDLSSKQYYFVSMATDGQVDSTGDGAYALGVVQNDPDAAGKAAEVAIGGRTKIVAGAAFEEGVALASDANGKAVTATTGDEILGVAMEASSADGDIVSMVFQPRGVL